MTILQSTWVYLWLDAVVKATVLLALTAVIASAARRASASSRHLIWALGLACSFVLPLLSMSLPHWSASVPDSPALRRLEAPVETQNAAAIVNVPPLFHLSPSVDEAIAPNTASEAKTHPATISSSAASSALVLKTPSANAAALSWPWIAGAIWATGAAFMLFRLAMSLMAVHRAAGASAAVASDALTGAADHAARMIPTAFDVQVRQAMNASLVRVPITWGARRPVILLPAEASQWPTERVQAALLHERAHIRRWDWSTLMLSRIVCAVYWFHPLAWLCARKMREASETACDDLVVLSGMSPAEYARQLLEVARAARKHERFGMSAVAMAQPQGVESRLRTVLASGLARRPMTVRWVIAAAAIALLIAIPLAAMRLKAKTLVEARHFPRNEVVDLVGVGMDPGNGQGKTWWDRTGGNIWWDQKGSRVSRPQVVNDVHLDVKTGWQSRHFVFHSVDAPPDTEVALTAPLSYDSTTWRNKYDHNEIYQGIVASYPNDVKTADIRVRVASGPWKTVASVPAAKGGARSITVGGVKARVEFPVPYDKHGQVMRCFVIHDVNNEDTRVVAIDDHGETLVGKLFAPDVSLYLGDGRNHPRYDFTLKGGATPKELQFQTRPYRWLEFSAIALQQNNATAAAWAPADTREATALTQIAHGELLQKIGRPGDGVAEFRKAITLDPNNADAHFKLAEALYNANSKRVGNTTYGYPPSPANLKEMVPQLQEAVRLNPDNSQYRHALGGCLAENGRHKEAIVHLRREQQILTASSRQPPAGVDPTNAADMLHRAQFDNHSLLGDCLLAAGDSKPAVIEFEQALKYEPQSDPTLLDYGKGLNKIGRRTEARAAWKKIIQTDQKIQGYFARQAEELLKQYPQS